jgi:predicted nucleotidyltransferase
MMPINKTQIERIKTLAKAYGATRLILFGSAVDMPKKAKDIDIACDGVPGWKLYELGARIEDELNISLDIIPLNPPTNFTRLIEKKGKELI